MFWHNLSLAVQGWDTLGCIYSVAIQFAECNSLPKTQLPGFPMGSPTMNRIAITSAIQKRFKYIHLSI